MSTSVRRLYKDIKPSSYQLSLVPDTQSLTFLGDVTITLKKTSRPSQRLTFHQNGLTITEASILRKEKKAARSIPVARINNQNTLHEVRLHTDEMLYPGDYEVHMQFKGTITKAMTGLYPCYFTVDGTEHCMLATQLESHYARDVFPCIDEPEAKATFQLSLVALAAHQVLSNTPIVSQETYGGQLPEGAAEAARTRTLFAITPRMSPYLLAFASGELHSKQTHTARGTEVSVWATIAQPAESFDFPLDIAKRCIEFFEDYFGLDYPLAKCDHLALPDFSSGAMENWGLVTYRERMLLAYPNETPQSTKEHIAEVIAHETSHQWFGNLVTMRWWNDLWLNESFANVMGYEAPAHLFPDWKIWDEFVASEGLASLRRDAQSGVQSVQTVVRHPDEIGSLFDPSIVYAKGGRLLYALKSYIGDAAFRKGLTAYFQRHAYGNTTGDDLWKALSEASGIDVGAFMNPWLEQSGFPVLMVDQQEKDITITQQHFLESGTQSDGRQWPVPLFANREDLPAVLNAEKLHRRLASADYVVLDHNGAGHYLVNYAQKAHQAYLLDLVRNQTFTAGERLMLLNNASMLAKPGHQSFDVALHLLDAYDQERAESVWGMIALVLGEARRFIDQDVMLEDAIKEFTRKTVQAQYGRLGWTAHPDESPEDGKLRATILALGAYGEDEAIINEGINQFRRYKQHPEQIDPELRAIVFGIAVKEKAEDALSYLLTLHDETNNGDLKADCMSALTTTKDTDDAVRLLDRLTDAKLVKPQDADYWLAYLLRNRHSRVAAWDWMVSHWEWIEHTYSTDTSYDSLPRYAASACNTREWIEKYRTFFEPKMEQIALKRNISIGLGEITARVAWLERDLASVQAFFKQTA